MKEHKSEILNKLRKHEVADMKKSLKHACEPLSAEALLSFEELEFRTLTGRFLGGACKGVAEHIVHQLLNEEDRKRIFESPYELGNRDLLDGKAVRQGPLTSHLETIQSPSGTEIQNVESVVKAIKHVVKNLTGNDFRAYTVPSSAFPDGQSNHSFAIKVLCTLYRYRMWEPKIFSRFTINADAERWNLELRDISPLKWEDDSARNGVALYSDLKQSLTFGMSEEEVGSILPTMERVANRFAQSGFAPTEVLFLYPANPGMSHLTIKQDDLADHLPLGNSRQANRLDIDLYVGLILREVKLRLLGKASLNRFLMRPEAYLPACVDWSADSLMEVIIALRARDWDTFRIKLTRLLGNDYSDAELNSAYDRHLKLTWIVKSPFDTDPTFNMLETLAAFITCLGKNVGSIRTKAYWYGKTTSSDSPLHYLDQLVDFQCEGVPEHYLEFWFRRFMLMLSRLVGREDLWHHQNDLEQFDGERIAAVLGTHDIFTAVKMLNLYFDRVPDIACPREEIRLTYVD
ncbi:hypothetical protein K5D34_02230 [Pseudomonas cichorii]|nr:hypothetical protein [Pseudomonas cichorii]MBX8508512.1 hypothetical protein [Pseudomonas cichorii]MBX8523828.1 hypothetical protein [Pseudomonas cichorii]MBX8558547.1 hypothetical protein [Pseudomonas cichorii]